MLDQRAALEAAQCLDQSALGWPGCQSADATARQGFRLPSDRQPEEELLLQWGQAGELLIQHHPDVIKDQCLLGHERGDIPTEDVCHCIGHKLEGQRVP